jgi:hypothetical protein
MKNYILLLITGFISTGVFAQQAPQTGKVSRSEVPQAVVEAYLSQNSMGKNDTLWEKDYITIYKVKYLDENRVYESQYSSDGKWIKTYTIIAVDELPVLVMNQVRTSYPEFTVNKAMIELSSNGKLYAVELQRGKRMVTEYFLMNGKAFK